MKITKRELHRLLGEAKKPKADDATQKTRPDGYTDLPTFMTHGRQSPTKYSGYGAGSGPDAIDDPAVADPESDSIDAGALRVVRQLQARSAGQKEDKKKLKERSMKVTRNDIRRLVNEALDQMGREDPDCLYILKRGGQHVYIVARPYIDDAAELAETGNDITDMIMSQGTAVRDANVYEFLSSNPKVAVVRFRGAYEMAEDYMMSLEDNLGASTGPVFEGHDFDMDDYEHAYSMGDGSDEEGFAIDYDAGRPSPFAAKMFGQPAQGADDIEGYDADEDVFGDDDMGRAGAMDDYRHALKMGGGRDEDGFAADYDTGEMSSFPSTRRGMNEGRWAQLAGILKG